MADYDPTAPLANDLVDGDSPNGDEHYMPLDAGEDDDDYDPSGFEGSDSNGNENDKDNDGGHVRTPVNDASVALQPTKPKTIGGFMVDSDDEEEQDVAQQQPPAPSQLNGTDGTQSGLGAVAVAEAQNVNTTLHSEAQEDTAAVPSAVQTAQSAPLNGSTPLVPAAVPDVAPPSTAATTFPSDISTPLQNPSASDQGKAVSPLQSVVTTPQAAAKSAPAASTQIKPTISQTPISQPQNSQRLPHDRVGQLEDRIKDDPKADTDAWKSLISHYREKNQIDNARKVYWRFFEIFPLAASMWVEFAQMELEHEEMRHVEEIFGACLMELPNIDMWNVYLDYLRRVHPLINDTDGSKRTIIASAFDVLLEQVGIDPDAGKLWREYVEFMKSGPGNSGGSGWQDQQKMDLVRKTFQKAIRLPHSEYAKLWKEYDNFELGTNKATARKTLLEQSPHYMTARGARIQLEQRIQGLDRSGLPVLPPLHGCEGDAQFATQVEKYRSWIEWEKDDPLVLKDEDINEYRKRIVYAYRQATMQLYFYPENWYDAASWCFDQGTDEMNQQGEKFLNKGITACPESVLLALMKADRLESSLEVSNTDEVAISNGEKLDVPYETVHTALYALMRKMQERLKQAVEKIKQEFSSLPPEEEKDEDQDADREDDDDDEQEKPKSRAEQEQEQIEDTSRLHHGRIDVLRRTISYVWVAKMRAFRRIQGQGTPGKPRKGFRGVFAEARPRGSLSSEVYIASALMEWHCYKDPSANKIFERGLKLFPLDEGFALEYIKFLLSRNDDVNARAVFETTVTKITQAPALGDDERREKCRSIMGYMHQYESCYGDLAHIQRLEKRLKDLFPKEPDLARFAHRFELPTFDALQAQLIISPTQARPKSHDHLPFPQQPVPTIEQDQPTSPPDSSHIRLGPNGPYVASPKRPLDDSDTDSPQRKFLRGDSPLKGAAGRRMQNLPAAMTSNTATVGSGGAGAGFITKNYVPANLPSGPAPLPDKINFLLSIIPRADVDRSTTFIPARMVEFLKTVDVEAARARIGLN